MGKTFIINILIGLLPALLVAQSDNVDSLRASVDFQERNIETVQKVNSLVDKLINKGQHREAVEWLENNLELAVELGDSAGELKTLQQLGDIYIARERPDDVLVYIDRIEELTSDPKDVMILHNQRGSVHLMKRQNLLALAEYERALAVADSIGDERYVAGMNMNLGAVYSNMDDNSSALRSYHSALNYAEAVQDSIFMATANNNVGYRFYEMGNHEQAGHYLMRSKQISREIDFADNLKRVLLNLGNLYSAEQEFEKADQYFREALEYARSTGDMMTEIRIYFNMGIMEGRKGNPAEARRLFTEGLEKSRDLGSAEGQFRNLKGLGRVELENGNYETAIGWFLQAKELVQGDDLKNLRLPTYEQLYRAAKRAGHTADALAWLERFDELKDQLHANEKTRLLAEYEALFDLQRSRQQAEVLQARQQETESRLNLQRWLFIISLSGGIVLFITAIISIRLNRHRREANEGLEESNRQLNKMNERVKTQNRELEEINQIKNKLFAIVAHDLRGPISSLQSLLYLIRDHELTESELNEISFSLERNLQENASMMDNLLAWARAQMNGIQLNRRRFMLHQAVKSVTDQIGFHAENKNVKLVADVKNEVEVYADYDMIKLVVRNLVANAIKFSRRNEEVTIRIESDDKLARVKVIDRGIGIKPEDQKKLFSKEHFTKRGTNNEKGSGLGLTLCKEFVEKHGGRLSFESREGEGTTFMFSIPIQGQSAEHDTSGKAVLEEQ
jgi:two-component system, sensor histidine kinase and response regulator